MVSRDESAGQGHDPDSPDYLRGYTGEYLRRMYEGPVTTDAAEAVALAFLMGLADEGADDDRLAAAVRGMSDAYFEQHKRTGEQ
jgi:predicted unusual protein kinase regulating ubiquinone biosynthesis (AarF/ABC1/UbiB family)